jgi:hypothetical protein
MAGHSRSTIPAESDSERLLFDHDSILEDDQFDTTKSRPQSFLKYIILFVLVGTGVSVLAIHSFRSSENNFTWTDCGNTSADAISKNCYFEPMLAGWVPPECYFSKPNDEYDPFSTRRWFWDRNLTNLADVESLKAGDYTEIFTRGHWHDEHCLYAWRKLAIAVDSRKPLIDSKSISLEHSTHCSKSISKRIVAADAGLKSRLGVTSSPIQFMSCVPLFWKS